MEGMSAAVSHLGDDDIISFLDTGAFLRRDDGGVILAWGEPETRADPVGDSVSFYAPDFRLQDDRPWRIFPRWAVASEDDIHRILGMAEVCSTVWETPSRSQFTLTINRALGMINDGKITKAVPTTALRSVGEISPSLRAGLCGRAIMQHEGTPYGIWDRREGIIGVTPERLFERVSGSFHIDAVAGTGSDRRGLRGSGKDAREHRIVLCDIVERCSKIPWVRSVNADAVSTVSFGGIFHLKSRVSLEGAGVDSFGDLVAALHPTPALGVAPRGDWRRICRELDIGERWRFGGPFGVKLNHGDIETCLVAIRCIQWRARKIELRAGCGVVVGSDPNAEYDELLAKFSATRSILGV